MTSFQRTDSGGEAASDPINLLLAMDERVTWGCAVTVRSTLENARAGTRFVVYILHDSLPEPVQDKLRQSWNVADRSVEVVFIDVKLSQSVELVRSKALTRMSYGRLLLGSALPPQVERCLYLDTDFLFEADVNDLYWTDLGGYTAAAVPDGSAEWDRDQVRRLGITSDHFYNSGLLLIDVERWRCDMVGERAIEYCKTVHPSVVAPFKMGLYFGDMDAINTVLAGSIKPVSSMWNTWASRLDTHKNVAIHLIAGPKPWHADYRGIFADRFFEYLDRTAFRGERPRSLAGLAPVLKRLSRSVPYPPTVWRIVDQTVRKYAIGRI